MTAARGANFSGDPVPVPLYSSAPPPTFPVDALPTYLRNFVADLSHATQTPTALPASMVLGALSACAGGRAVIEVRQGWVEPLTLYLCTVLPPASRKSAVVKVATKPLWAAENRLQTKHDSEFADVLVTQAIAKKAADKAQSDAARADDDSREEMTEKAVGLARAAREVEVPPVPRWLADDITIEAATSRIAESGGRLAIISAEAGIISMAAGRYSGGAVTSLDVFLKGHAGDTIRVDRKGRPSEQVDNPALTIAITAQPGVMKDIASNVAFRERGLTARFLFSVPESNIGRRLVPAAPVSEAVLEQYDQVIADLAYDLADWHSDPAVLVLSPGAHETFLAAEVVLEGRLGPEGDLGPISDWGGKAMGAAARIAGLLHLAEHGAGGTRKPISEDAVGAALLITEFFVEHAKRAFSILGEDGPEADAAHFLDVIKRQKLAEFSRRDLYNLVRKRGFDKADDIDAGLNVLLDLQWLIRVEPPEPEDGKKRAGRKPSPKFRPNAHLWMDSPRGA